MATYNKIAGSREALVESINAGSDQWAIALSNTQPTATAFTAGTSDLATGGGYTQGGGRPTRKGYIIKGQRYWLDDRELAVLIAQMLSEVKRADVQEVKDDKPKVLSRRTWLKLKASLKALEDLAEAPQDDDDEDEELMLLLM